MDNHPTPEHLADFGLGRLGPEESTDIEGHLASCETCCRALKTQPGDPFVTLLRSTGTTADRMAATLAAPPAADTSIPAELADHARYRVERLLGAGGMGVVFQATHLRMGRPVALKVIGRRLLERPEVVDRFHREVRTAARLVHPNIVTAYDADEAGGLHFLVMEYVAGVSLARLVADQGPLSAALACDHIRQAALGLQHAFEQGMVHRDVKPQNLMLTQAQGSPGSVVKILDFGLVGFAHEVEPQPGDRPQPDDGPPGITVSENLTHSGTVMGTPDYIAPEQIRDSRHADIRADVYSLGCTLYFLLTGRPPFADEDFLGKLAAHASKEPRSPANSRSDLPPGLDAVLGKMMAKDPAGRYQTPAEVAAALVPFTRTDRPDAPGRRGWLWWAAAVLLVCLLGGVGVYVVSWPGLELQGPSSGDDSPLISPLEISESRRFVGPRENVWCAAFALDGGRVLAAGGGTYQGSGKWAAGNDYGIYIWNEQTGKLLHRLTGHTNTVHGVALDVRKGLVLSGSSDRTLRVWDAVTGKELYRLGKETEDVHALVLSADGQQVLAGYRDGSLRLWSIGGRNLVREFPGHSDVIRAVALRQDGRLALSGGHENAARLWDVATGKELRQLKGHMGRIHDVALSPDGTLALTGGSDRTMRLWDTADAREIRQFGEHATMVESVAFSPDGKRVLSGGHDGDVSLWEVASGRRLARLRGHTGKVFAVAFSPNGKWALSGATDAAVRLWRLPAEQGVGPR